MVNEITRGIGVNKKNEAPTSYRTYVKQMSGGSPVIVIISNLKDGFKQLETNYFPGNTDRFKSTYIQMYGQDIWDRRINLLQEVTNNVESEMVKLREDLSSK